ncbi:hypothetical protein [Vreelandella malpeensis]|uniref:Uncharacterized protein n=2 Tax=Halomonadaceae TaxID=28256 RepID=A0ABS8DPK0_9GAMM|nr:hypothetical protein [Halomonas malpeensis]MCB8888173.1 hypothetical protein [Halomonas malpeensis]
MNKDALKKLGILGVSFGLMASPLAFAGMEEGTAPQEPTPHEDTMQDDQGTYQSYETDQQPGATTEYEEEEQEFTYEEEEEEQEFTYEEEEEEQEWDTDSDTDSDS